jgi:hypothetical protein
MRNIISEHTNHNHKNFLESISYDKEFDPFSLKTWHHEFNLIEHNSPIPIFEIIEKPGIKITTIRDFVNSDDNNNTMVKKAFEADQKEDEFDNDRCESDFTNVSSNSNSQMLSKFMSKDLFNKV